MSTVKFESTGDFVGNVMKALAEYGGDYRALRLDKLADIIAPNATDGSHRWTVYDAIKAITESEEKTNTVNASLGLTSKSNVPFEVISAREQEGYGFPRLLPKLNEKGEQVTVLVDGEVVPDWIPVYPKATMGGRPGTQKRTRKAKLAVADATNTAVAKEVVNYWPIVAVKDPGRAGIKIEIGLIADKVLKLIQAEHGNRYDVILGSKSFTVKFGGVTDDE